MERYEEQAYGESKLWQKKMMQSPSFFNRASKSLQNKINSYIPEKVHGAITLAIKQMVQAMIFGSKYTAPKPLTHTTLALREILVHKRIKNYRTTAAIEGGITGAGGLLMGLADFPLLIGIKLKLLFDIAALYGYDVKDFRERLYILHIFQLAFSSAQHRREMFLKLRDWKTGAQTDALHEVEWRAFQQEYRDYLDIAKLAQLIPVIGAPVGLIVNYRLIRRLGYFAMNAYRMRYFHEQNVP